MLISTFHIIMIHTFPCIFEFQRNLRQHKPYSHLVCCTFDDIQNHQVLVRTPISISVIVRTKRALFHWLPLYTNFFSLVIEWNSTIWNKVLIVSHRFQRLSTVRFLFSAFFGNLSSKPMALLIILKRSVYLFIVLDIKSRINQYAVFEFAPIFWNYSLWRDFNFSFVKSN